MVRLGGDPDPLPARQLLARYAEPHRRYHTVAHLTAVLSTVDRLAPCADHLDAVRLAAWYHDAVYDPRRPDNEERSAELAEAELAPLAAGTIARVAALVRLTAGHHAAASDGDAGVLCDADLAMLAAPAAAYERYVAAVRREYAHLDDEAWQGGRTAVLLALLALRPLFQTSPGREWEPAARHNISRELAALGGRAGGAAPPR